MNRVTAAAIAFLVFAIGVSAWLLLRTGSPAAVADEAPTGLDAHAGLTFAEWSVRGDGALLADIDPGAGVSTVPRRFVVLKVKQDADGTPHVSDGPTFSWAPADRAASAGALFALGFRVNAEGLAFVAPDDPLWSNPIAKDDAATEQKVTLRAKSGVLASFVRRRSDPRSTAYWSRRAIGFASADGRLVYVTPDAVVIPTAAR